MPATLPNPRRSATGQLPTVALACLLLIIAPTLTALAQTGTGGPLPHATPPATTTAPSSEAAPPVPAAQAAPPSPATAPTAGPELVPRPLIRRLDALVPEFDRLAKAVERVRGSDAELERQRAELEALRTSTAELRHAFAPPLRAITEQLQKLGPRPKPPAPAETPAIEGERNRLEQAVSRIDAAIKTLALTDERARQLVGRIQGYRNELISRDILQRTPSPMLPSVWQVVAGEMPRAVRQVTTILSGWSDLLASRPLTLALILLVCALAHILLTLTRAHRLPSLVPEPAAVEPGTVKRLANATLAAALKVAPGFAATVLLIASIRFTGLDNQLVAPLLESGLLAYTVATVTRLLAHAVLMPQHPSWRAIGIASGAARQLTLLVTLIGAVLAVDIVLDTLVRVLHLPPAVGIVKTHLATTAIAGLIGAVAMTGLPPGGGNGAAQRTAAIAAGWLRLPLLILAVGLVATSAVGYVGLAGFIARQTLAAMTGIVALLLINAGLRSALEPLAAPAPGEGASIAASPPRLIDRARQGMLPLVLQVALSAIAGITILSLLLLSWGFSTADLAGWGRAALFGFKIGDYTISLWRIMVAGILFAGVLVATRLLQRWLGGVVLVPQRMDAGIAHSIETGIGYLGTILAALIGLSYAGLDITNLAIVAGALSVGIGFGLQSIVNNFVSGLILLVERPIKVGDWIVVGEHQGHVRRISVRATEIETFDRASVVVPNSQLISGTVQNWTLRNAMGRLTIKVSAAYDSDPEHVMKVIMSAVERCQTILTYPAPRVTFSDFGASALDFTVHAFIGDVSKGLDAQTELRTAIFKAFRKEGIEIPFPQADVHLRDLDAVRALVARLAEERLRRPVEEPSTAAASTTDPSAMPRGDGA
ncbi:MAG: DUF3772 domain-containing protein [Hyphomicrobiaceae bacterium]